MPSTCFVPGCKTGYNKTYDGKYSLFLPPKNPEIFKLWEKKIPRADRRLGIKDFVCELHFEPGYIERDYVHIINGEEVRIPRGKAKLQLGAVPTIFPNVPHYLSSETHLRAFKRPRDRSNVQPAKRRRKSCKIDGEPEVDNSNSQPPSESNYEGDIWEWLSSCTMLEGWARKVLSDTTVIFYSRCGDDDVYWSELIQVKWKKGEPIPEVFARHQKVPYCKPLENYSGTIEGIEILLSALAKVKLCEGINITQLPTPASVYSCPNLNIVQNRCFSKKCLVMVDTLCLQCKYLKRLLCRERKVNVPTMYKYNANMYKMNRSVKRYASKQRTVHNEIKNTLEQNKQSNQNVIKEAISQLPKRQQEAVHQCFKHCLSKKAKYSKEWVLECLMMRIKSPGLYKHLRNQNILALPSPRTLNEYIRGIDAGCGIANGVLHCLKTKLQHLDENDLQRHGVLCLDEMALSEQFEYDPRKGKVIGLVDLGTETTPD